MVFVQTCRSSKHHCAHIPERMEGGALGAEARHKGLQACNLSLLRLGCCALLRFSQGPLLQELAVVACTGCIVIKLASPAGQGAETGAEQEAEYVGQQHPSPT